MGIIKPLIFEVWKWNRHLHFLWDPWVIFFPIYVPTALLVLVFNINHIPIGIYRDKCKTQYSLPETLIVPLWTLAVLVYPTHISLMKDFGIYLGTVSSPLRDFRHVSGREKVLFIFVSCPTFGTVFHVQTMPSKYSYE